MNVFYNRLYHISESNRFQFFKNYLKPIAACQTKANNKKKTGIIGKTSTIGLKATYASGKRDNNKVSINKDIYLKFLILIILILV